MRDLKEIRKDIDKIDNQLIELFIAENGLCKGCRHLQAGKQHSRS